MNHTTSRFFLEFLANIEPSQQQKNDLVRAHEELRDRLDSDEAAKPMVDTVFLQGSYKRNTLVLSEGDEKPDIDVVLVTKLDEATCSPQVVHDEFKPFLDRHYAGEWEPNNRSFAIKRNKVKLDMVPTAALPADQQKRLMKAFSNNRETLANASFLEVLAKMEQDGFGSVKFAADSAAMKEPPANWRDHPLRIPDRDLSRWEDTNPLAQIQWTRAKNQRCGGGYVPLVKAIKWWRRQQGFDRPKGYPLEHLVGVCCPDKAMGMEELVTATFVEMYRRFKADADAGRVPVLLDHGVEKHDVMHRITGEQFRAFHGHVHNALAVCQAAMQAPTPEAAARAWQRLFGKKFPAPAEAEQPRTPPSPPTPPPASGPFKPPSAPSRGPSERYA